MAVDFKLPDLGEGITEGDVSDILVAEGEMIRADQDVVEIETGKAVVPVACPHAGKVAKIHVHKGSKVPVGGLLLTVEAGTPSAALGRGGEKQTPGKSTKAAGAETKDSPKEAPTATKQAKPEKEEAPAIRADGQEDGEERDGEEPADAPAEDKGEESEPASPDRGLTSPSRQGETTHQASTDREDRGHPEGTRPPARQEPPPPASGYPPPDYRGGDFEPRTSAATNDLPVAAGPETRRYARELGVDLRVVTGTGPDGRITKEDVTAAVRATISAGPATASKPASAPTTPKPDGVPDRDPFGTIRRTPLSKIRETIAHAMAHSAATIPHVTNFDDADVTELERIRKGSMADYLGDVKLTLLSFVIKAAALALRQHHEINASLDLEKKQIVYKDYVNIGVAVDTERGLVVPVLRDVDRMTIPQIALQLTQMATSVRSGRFKPDDIRGGTFTISNLGAVGGTYSTPIINAPEVAILLLGRSRRMPVAVNDATEIRLMMPLSISYDHRLVDGATAARFLNEVKAYLEVPGRLLLAP